MQAGSQASLHAHGASMGPDFSTHLPDVLPDALSAVPTWLSLCR